MIEQHQSPAGFTHLLLTPGQRRFHRGHSSRRPVRLLFFLVPSIVSKIFTGLSSGCDKQERVNGISLPASSERRRCWMRLFHNFKLIVFPLFEVPKLPNSCSWTELPSGQSCLAMSMSVCLIGWMRGHCEALCVAIRSRKAPNGYKCLFPEETGMHRRVRSMLWSRNSRH